MADSIHTREPLSQCFDIIYNEPAWRSENGQSSYVVAHPDTATILAAVLARYADEKEPVTLRKEDKDYHVLLSDEAIEHVRNNLTQDTKTHNEHYSQAAPITFATNRLSDGPRTSWLKKPSVTAETYQQAAAIMRELMRNALNTDAQFGITIGKNGEEYKIAATRDMFNMEHANRARRDSQTAKSTGIC